MILYFLTYFIYLLTYRKAFDKDHISKQSIEHLYIVTVQRIIQHPDSVHSVT